MRRRLSLADDAGNMAVEFALVLPIFLTLFMGMVDYGSAALAKSRMEAAARAGMQAVLKDKEDLEGALAAATVVANDEDMDIDVVSACRCSDGGEVECTDTCPVGDPREEVTITVSRDYTLLVPWPGFDDPLALSATARVRVQ